MTVQSSPASYVVGEELRLLKVDHAVFHGGYLLVAGWSSDEDAKLGLSTKNGPAETSIVRCLREDVASGLGRPRGRPLGFVLICEAFEDPVHLLLELPGEVRRFPLATTAELAPDARLRCAPGVLARMASLAVGSRAWRHFLSLMPERAAQESIVIGMIDQAYRNPSHGLGFAAGWETHRPDALVWLEDDLGNAFDLSKGFRWTRDDVERHVVPLEEGAVPAGFLSRLAMDPAARSVRLSGADELGVQRLAFRPLQPLSRRAAEAAERLLEVPTPRFLLTERFTLADLPLLGEIRHRERAAWKRSRPRVRSVGPVPESPSISVIVPVFGRLDVVENQLLEFDRDDAFKHDIEIVYVLDDPSLEDQFQFSAPHVQRLAGPGFRWVATGENRGFSGANNLGAEIARGQTLIFMNSDVFPIEPGWAAALTRHLETDQSVGLVAPRLVFPNGTIQHAGMIPNLVEEYGLYTNRHPMMGMDTAFDPQGVPVRVPLVTGACVAVRASDFERVAGWDEGYIVGDFEDSDLCLRMRRNGLEVRYDPTIELIHLERQSLGGLDETAVLRERLTLLNCCRYNALWSAELRGLAS